MSTYTFEVKATYTYEVEADTEKKARAILIEEGGLDIMGELNPITREDYDKAVLVEESLINAKQ